MQIKLLDMKLENFKGIKSFDLSTAGNNVNIYGDNETGKSTLHDAFRWILFDKNSEDKKDFSIKTVGMSGAEHSVKVTLLVDGDPLELKKSYHEKYTKKRGSESESFTGHETDYWINEVPSSKAEFDQKIKLLIDENLFKMLTDVLYFNQQIKWQDRRKVLVEMAGDVSDEILIESNEKLHPLLKILGKHTIDEYARIVKEKKKQINDEIKKIPVRIDEAEKTKPEAPELLLEELKALSLDVSAQLNKLSTEKGKIDLTLERFRENTKLVLEYENAIAKERDQIFRTFNLAKMDLQSKNNDTKAKLETYAKLKAQTFRDLEEQIELKSKRLETLASEFGLLKATRFDENSTVCPTCTREFEADKVQELKDNFTSNLKQKGEEIKRLHSTLKAEIEEAKEKLFQANIERDEAISKFDTFVPEPVPTEPNYETEKIKLLQEKLIPIKAEQEAYSSGERAQEDTTERDMLTAQLKCIDADILVWETIEKQTKRVDELSEELKKLNHEYAQYERAEFLTEEFIKTKVGSIQDKINSMFTMVEFKLFKQQINGGIDECCEAMVKGVPYADVNNAGKINAGLDIIDRLSKYYGVSAPIWIDNSEGVTKFLDCNTQVIKLYVSEADKQLRTESEV